MLNSNLRVSEKNKLLACEYFIALHVVLDRCLFKLSMQKKFLTNLGLLVLLTLLVKPFWILFIDREVQNVVGTENYGFYFALLNFSFLFNILLDLGITTYNNRNIAQNPEDITEQLGAMVSLKFLFAATYTVVTLLAGFVIGYSNLQLQMLVILCLNQFLGGFILYLRSNLSGLHLFRSDAVISILDRLLMICICCVLLWGNVFEQPFNIWWFVYAQTVAYGAVLLVALVVVLKSSGLRTVHWSMSRWKSILKESLPFALMILLMTIYMRTDSVMLERLLPDGAMCAGIYAQGYRLLDAAMMFAMLIAVLLLPIYSRMLSKKEAVEGITRLSYGLIIAPSLILAISVSLYSKEVLSLLYLEIDEQSSSVLSWLMLSLIPISTTYVFGTLLTANNNLKYLNIMAFAGIVINIGLNFMLIPSMKAEGAAIASIITQFVVAIIQVFLIQYIFKFRVNYPFLLSVVLLAGLLVSFGQFTKSLSDNWMLNIGVLVVCTTAVAFLLKLISINSVIGILKGHEEPTR